MKSKSNAGIPEFQSLEEEREYWESRGPLAEGHEGKINKPRRRQKRSSFLVVRLTGEELTHLRDIAANQGLGTSTFARLVLTQAIEHKGSLPKVITSGQFMNTLANNLSQTDKDKFESFFKEVAIGDPDNPALLVFSGERKSWEEYTSLFLQRLLALLGIQIITPKDGDYEKVREIVKNEPDKEVINT